jgi:general stress protein 26
MTAELTTADRAFLNAPRIGFLTVAPRTADAWPAPRPVWFEVTDKDTIELFSGAAAPKVRNIEAEPRASLVAANALGEPEHWISVVGKARIEADGAHELAARLGARYWNLDDPDQKETLDSILADELVRIVIEPEIVRRYG